MRFVSQNGVVYVSVLDLTRMIGDNFKLDRTLAVLSSVLVTEAAEATERGKV